MINWILPLASLFAGLSIGYLKFFMLGVLTFEFYSSADKHWIIQLVGGLITLGPFIIFPLAAPLATAFHKSSMMCWTGLTVALILALGLYSNWMGTPWMYVFIAGLGLGVFNAARNAAIPLESVRTNRPTEQANAAVGNLYIVGLLVGVPLGTELYATHPGFGALALSLLFLIAAAFGARCIFPAETKHLRTLSESRSLLYHDCCSLFRSFHWYLFVVPMLWGIAGALSLGATAYCEEVGFASALLSSLMSVYAAFGVVAGNIIATRLTKIRFTAAFLAVVVLATTIIGVAVIGQLGIQSVLSPTRGYILLSALLCLTGIAFGLSTNLLESRYFANTYTQGKEGTGAALLSALTAAWAFLLGTLVAVAMIHHFLDSTTQFLALGAAALLVAFMIRMLEKSEDPILG